ncbi:MAG: TetR/AcrR family transcriptional regulator [Candidatus Omnitrophica bacterium]|nr:TetR/AcrR family transcriptional regulator [Candidatus Omnitrophota bacterium]
MRQRKNSKELILDAAEAVVLEVGAAHMSLDHVARKAGVSKGGLMYNFPTKNALLKEMIARFIRQYYINRDKKLEDIEEGPARLFKAGILTALAPDKKRDSMGSSILAASANEPDLMDLLRQAHRNMLEDILVSGIKFERAAIISLAVDGLMFGRLLKTLPFNQNQIKKIEKEIMRLIDKEAEK